MRRLLALVGGLVLFSVHVAAETPAPQQNLTLDIPSQPIGDALSEFGKQSGLQVVLYSAAAEGIVAPRVAGKLTAQEALERLLANTGLEYEFLSEKGVAVRERRQTSRSPDANVQRQRQAWMLAQAEGSTNTDEAASAQDSQEGSGAAALEELSEIVVTGTHIRGVPSVTSPVIVLDKAYIDSTGLSTTTGLMQSLPQNFALASPSGVLVPGVSGPRTQGSSINLRGIGEGTTLILLNGRRIALGFIGAAVDISALPLSAVDRVEILTDGASAVYGSDAVGGVVNFILRDDFEGAETRLRSGWADGGIHERRASQVVGHTWASGNVIVSGEYYQRDLLRASERDFVPGGSEIGSLLPREENHAVSLSARQKITEPVSLFADALYSKRNSYNEGGQVSIHENFDSDDPQVTATLGFDWRVSEDWRIETSGSYAQDELEQRQHDDSVADAGFGDLLFDTRFAIRAAQIKADGPILSLPAGRVRVAAGLDWRSESLLAASVFSTGDFPARLKFDQIARSAFAEAQIPIVGSANAMAGIRRLDLSVAGRLDDYSTFGSSFDPKVGVLWEPVAGLRLRASYGTSYVAPRLADHDPSFNAVSAITADDPGAPGGTSRQLQIFGTDVDGLRPQESESLSFGVALAPSAAPGLQLGLNYYRIDYRDRIANPPFPSVILGNPASFGSLTIRGPTLEQVAAAVAFGEEVGRFFDCDSGCEFNPDFDPASIAVIVDSRRRNLSALKTSGFDASLEYAFAAAGGEIELGLNGTHILEIDQKVTSASDPFDTVDTFNNPPDSRARASFGFRRGGWNTNFFVNYTGSYTDNRLALPVAVDSYTTVDARLAYEFQQHGAGGWRSGLTLSANVQNLLDEDPPRTAIVAINTDMGFDPTNANPIGRLVAAEISKAW